MLHQKIEAALEKGYSFEMFHERQNAHAIRFYKHKDMLLVLRYSNTNLRYISTEFMRSRIGSPFSPENLVDSGTSWEFIRFILDYIPKGLYRLENWRGWVDGSGHVYVHCGNTRRRLNFDEIEPNPDEFKGIELPDIIAPVASIIFEYARCPLYHSLVKVFAGMGPIPDKVQIPEHCPSDSGAVDEPCDEDAPLSLLPLLPYGYRARGRYRHRRNRKNRSN